jgi:hypothetical protein
VFGPRRVHLLAVIAALALVASACGSTVNEARRAEAARRSGQSSGLDTTEGNSAFDGQTGDGTGDGLGNGGATVNGVSGGRTTGGTVGRNSATQSSGSTAPGPGVSATSINIGLGFSVNAGAGNAAIGIKGVSVGDDKGEQQAVIDDINAHGGAGGRKLVPVWHPYDGTSTDSADVQEQKACDDYTQDHKTFVAFDRGRDTFNQCMQSRGSFNIADGGITDTAASTYKRFPYYVELTTLNLDRASAVEPGILNQEGYFSGWDATLGQPAQAKAKVGIITYDYPTFSHAVEQVMVPALRALGHAPDPNDIRKVTWLQSNSDAGALAAAVSSAVLRFRQDQVTHVIILDERALITLLFIREADSQRFRPRYGFNSTNGVQVLVDGGNLNADQLNGALGLGWYPSFDITPSQNPDDGPYSNNARRKCMALMKAKGFTFADANAEAVALGGCNLLYFFQQVANSVSGPLNRDSFIAAVNAFGTRYENSETFLNRFSATQHDGVAAVRQWKWDTGCSCGKYTSGNIDVA